jgi:hypothetical protein
MNKFDKNRMENSIKCCELLIEYFKNNPHIRFGQAVENIKRFVYNDKDMFYEEPEDTYIKLKEFVK